MKRQVGYSVYCINIDECTDNANRAQMVVVIRWYDVQTGLPREVFLGVVNLDKGDADTIFEKLIAFVRGEGFDLTRWIGFGSDGASVMTGVWNGVAAKLKRMNPYMICTHCCSHRFALVCSHASQNVPYMKNVYEPLLISIWSFLFYSPQRWASLQAHWVTLKSFIPELKTMTVISKAVHTRWLSHLAANTSLLRGFVCLLDWLLNGDYSTNETGQGLAVLMNTYFFWRTLYMMGDLLTILSICSVSLQSPDLDFSYAIRMTRKCQSDLVEYRKDISTGEFSQQFAEFFDAHYELHEPKWPRMVTRAAARPSDAPARTAEEKAERAREVLAASIFNVELTVAPRAARAKRPLSYAYMNSGAIAMAEAVAAAEYDATQQQLKAAENEVVAQKRAAEEAAVKAAEPKQTKLSFGKAAAKDKPKSASAAAAASSSSSSSSVSLSSSSSSVADSSAPAGRMDSDDIKEQRAEEREIKSFAMSFAQSQAGASDLTATAVAAGRLAASRKTVTDAAEDPDIAAATTLLARRVLAEAKFQKDIGHALIDGLIGGIESRFPNVDILLALEFCFCGVDFPLCPLLFAKRPDWQKHVEILAAHFGQSSTEGAQQPAIDVEAFRDEMVYAKAHLWTAFEDAKTKRSNAGIHTHADAVRAYAVRASQPIAPLPPAAPPVVECPPRKYVRKFTNEMLQAHAALERKYDAAAVSPPAGARVGGLVDKVKELDAAASIVSVQMMELVTCFVNNGHAQSQCPQWVLLAIIAVTIAVSTASCERAFSVMNLIMTKLRSRMSQEMLDALMRIKMCGGAART